MIARDPLPLLWGRAPGKKGSNPYIDVSAIPEKKQKDMYMLCPGPREDCRAAAVQATMDMAALRCAAVLLILVVGVFEQLKRL